MLMDLEGSPLRTDGFASRFEKISTSSLLWDDVVTDSVWVLQEAVVSDHQDLSDSAGPLESCVEYLRTLVSTNGRNLPLLALSPRTVACISCPCDQT